MNKVNINCLLCKGFSYSKKMYGLASCSGVMVKYIPNVGKVNVAVEPAVRAIIPPNNQDSRVQSIYL